MSNKFSILANRNLEYVGSMTGEKKFLCAVTNGEYLGIILESPFPWVSKFPFMKYQEVSDRGNRIPNISCAAFSQNSKYFVTGHLNGIIRVIDMVSLTTSKIIKRNSSARIKFISFANDDQSFYCIDELFNIFGYQFKTSFGFTTYKEILIPFPNNAANSISRLSTESPIVVISTQNSIHVCDIVLNSNEEVFHSSDQGEILTKFSFSSHRTEVFIVCNRSYTALSVEQDGKWRTNYVSLLEFNVLEFFVLCNNYLATINDDCSLQIYSTSGQIGDYWSSNELKEILSKRSLLVSANEQLYCAEYGVLTSICFPRWNEHFHQALADSNWGKCFEIAKTVYNGKNRSYFGIQSDIHRRILSVHEEVYSVFGNAIHYADTESKMRDIIDFAVDLDTYDFFDNNLLTYLKTMKKLPLFFKVLFEHKNIEVERCVTLEMINELFINCPDIAEELLVRNLVILKKFPAQILNLAKSHGMKRLCLSIYIDVYNDHISLCNFFYRSDEFYGYIDSIFLNPENSSIRYDYMCVVLLWLFTPFENCFPRAERLFSFRLTRSQELLESFICLLPITFRNGVCFGIPEFVDCILRVVSKIPYELVPPILEFISPILTEKSLCPPLISVQVIVRWVFTSKNLSFLRERVLQVVNCFYPELIVFKDLLDYCKSAGFSEVINHFYISEKRYDLVIETMEASPERRAKVFDFIDEHINEIEDIKKAMIHNIQFLILQDSHKVVEIVLKYFPDYHKTFISQVSVSIVKFQYLKSIVNDESLSSKLSADDQFLYFQLLCEFEPHKVLSYLRSTPSILLDAALPFVLRFHVVEACVYVYRMLGNIEAAASLISEELENDLVSVCDSNMTVNVPSIDRVADDKLMRKPFQTLQIAFNIVDLAPKLGQTLQKMWKGLFNAFQLPLWLSQALTNVDTKKSIILFFAFFVVNAISKTTPEFVLEELTKSCSSLDTMQLKKVLKPILGYLNQQNMLNSTVQGLLKEDCYSLFRKAFTMKSKSAIVYNPICSICQNSINGSGGIGAIVFQCGHCYHNNILCGGHTSCPVCKGEHNTKNATSTKAKSNNRQKQRQLQRVEYGLRKQYGEDADLTSMGKNIYFLPEYKFDNAMKRVLKPPTSIPPSTPVYLEI